MSVQPEQKDHTVPPVRPNWDEDPVNGVGPWPGGEAAWPAEAHYDRELLAAGDRRNVPDQYRYWTVAAISEELDRQAAERIAQSGAQLEIAIENLGHDFNIGSIVRTANALGVRHVHVVGKRRWNRRGAMVTDRYLHVHHHESISSLRGHAKENDLVLVGFDNVCGSVPLENNPLPPRCLLVVGSENEGISAELLAACDVRIEITQYGSTRSMNVGAAAAIAMWSWSARYLSC